MPRKLRLAGHPVHPALSDFPLALLPISLLWQVLAVWTGTMLWWEVNFWTQAAGLALAVPTAVSGLWDYASLPRESPAVRTATWHLFAMVTALSAFTGSFLVAGRSPSTTGREYGALALSAFGLVVILVGGWLGGHLVFRHGVGVGEVGSRRSEGGSTEEKQ